MGLLDMFRPRPPIGDMPALAAFIDENAAFLTQKGIYGTRAPGPGTTPRSCSPNPASRKLWKTPAGAPIRSVSPWWRSSSRACFAATAALERQAVLDALAAMVLAVFDRYAVPAALSGADWRDCRNELERRLGLIGIHAVKPAKDIPVPFAEAYFGLMPIDRKLRASEFPTIRNYLRVTLCNIHEEFSKRADVPGLAAMLSSAPELRAHGG